MFIEDFYIHKDVIGHNKHILVSNNKLIPTNKIIGNKWVFGSSDAELPDRSISALLSLNGFKTLSFPQDEKWQKTITCVTKEQSTIPWSFVLPQNIYLKSVRKLANSISDFLKISQLEYYQTFHQISNRFLNSFEPCKLNEILWKTYSQSENNNNILESFKTVENSLTNVVKYDRNTKTGRLRTIFGPNILQLKKDYRDILKSKFQQGKLYYIDYSSLEPRVLLAIQNQHKITDVVDIYQHVLNELNLGGIDRKAIKHTILSQLYGASEETIIKELGNIENPHDFIKIISEFFGMNSLKKNLVENLIQESERCGFYNYYGRWVDCTDAKPYMFINYFIQSTAVDVAINGFSLIIKEIIRESAQKFISPIFILHDALILDVAPEGKDSLERIVKAGMNIPKFPDVKFHLTTSEL